MKYNELNMYSGPLFIASDHGGFQLKKRLIRYIENELHLSITDIGPFEYDETDDYPDYVKPLTEAVLASNGRGIVICKNGVGVCMAANKVSNIRCGQGYNTMAAQTMMQDDNTNVISLAAKSLSEDLAMAVIKTWLSSEFSQAERHIRRLNKIQKFS